MVAVAATGFSLAPPPFSGRSLRPNCRFLSRGNPPPCDRPAHDVAPQGFLHEPSGRLVGRPVSVEMRVDLLELGDVHSVANDYAYLLILRGLGDVRQSDVLEVTCGRTPLQDRFCFQAAFDACWEVSRLRRLLASETLRLELVRVPLHDTIARQRSDFGAERVAAFRLCPWPWLLQPSTGGAFCRATDIGGSLCAEVSGEHIARPLVNNSASGGCGSAGDTRNATPSGARRNLFLSGAPTAACSGSGVATCKPKGIGGSIEKGAQAVRDGEGPWLRLHLHTKVAYDERGCDSRAAKAEARLLPGRGDVVDTKNKNADAD
eukprot:TRINITY_DN16755_c0_g1_i1.p1 TRINITY_DN16755_c0_g1~~TRINITY_DN16755_c0_g1_i1.p1  ORF type:complete len:319 (+),score=46.19 TRINITY_DN16755_c0_g1_i1:63-1019(+)